MWGEAHFKNFVFCYDQCRKKNMTFPFNCSKAAEGLCCFERKGERLWKKEKGERRGERKAGLVQNGL